jgi:hypothetical protein
MPRFVILQHDHPFLHWDFMLEVGAALRTWRLASTPLISTPLPSGERGRGEGIAIAATPLGDHRLAYLDYEGPLSGNRGSVVRWDAGDYEVIEMNDQRVVVRLRGRRTAGTATLTGQDEGDWQFTLAAD